MNSDFLKKVPWDKVMEFGNDFMKGAAAAENKGGSSEESKGESKMDDKNTASSKDDKNTASSKDDKPESAERLPVPELPPNKKLAFSEFKPFMDTTLPNFFKGAAPTESGVDSFHLQLEAIDTAELTPKIFTQLFFNMNLHRGWNAASAEPSGYPIFLPPNSWGLFRYFSNESQKSEWTCCVDFTKRGEKSSMICSVDAYADIASPFCSFASRVTNEQQTQELKIESTFRMSNKQVLPIGKFKFLPHQAIHIDEGDVGEIGIAPEFSKSVLDTFSDMDPHKVDLQTVIDKMSAITQVYGDCYLKKLTFGVAAYEESEVKIKDQQQLTEVKNYQALSVKGMGTIYGIPVSGSASISQDDLKRLENQFHKESSKTKKSYIGIAAGTTDQPDIILKYRMNSKQWAVINVEQWGAIQELFPASVQSTFKIFEKRFPSFVWKLGVNMNQRYVLIMPGLDKKKYVITRWVGVRREGYRWADYDMGALRNMGGEVTKEDFLERLIAIPASNAIAGDILGKYTWNEEEIAWIIVSNASMGQRIALKHYRERNSNKFLTVNWDSNRKKYIAGLREINDNQFGPNDLFEVTIADKQFIRIGWQKDGSSEPIRYLKYNTELDSVVKCWSKDIKTEHYRNFLYTKSTTYVESESWPLVDSYELEFMDHHVIDDSTKWTISDTIDGIMQYEGLCKVQ